MKYVIITIKKLSKLTNLENYQKNGGEISEIKTDEEDFEIKIKENLKNISEFENKFKKCKEINDKNSKDLQEKINEANYRAYPKFDEITKEINKIKYDLINKKIEGLKIKNDKSYNEVLDNLKEQLNDLQKIIIIK